MDPQKPLTDPQREAFARAVARGVHREKAYRMAGIGHARSAAWAMENRPEVEARIASLKVREARMAVAATAPTLAALVRIVDLLQGAAGPLAREARLTLKLISELRAIVDQETHDAVTPPPPPAFTPVRRLTMQEWIDKYAHLGRAGPRVQVRDLAKADPPPEAGRIYPCGTIRGFAAPSATRALQ